MSKIYDNEQLAKVEAIRLGEFVRRVNKDGSPRAKTFVRGEYDKASKTFSLYEYGDTCKEVFVKRGTQLLVGFTF